MHGGKGGEKALKKPHQNQTKNQCNFQRIDACKDCASIQPSPLGCGTYKVLFTKKKKSFHKILLYGRINLHSAIKSVYYS